MRMVRVMSENPESGAPRSLARTLGRAALVAGGALAALTAADVAVVAGGILRAAYRYPRPVEDGPDPLLAPPRNMRSSAVGAADGALLHVETSTDLETHPSEEVLVFAHGWTCSTRFWNAQVNHFTGERPMIAYDQRGHGLSEMGRTKASAELLGQDLEAVLEATLPAGKRAVLVGHSMGGMTLMSWAQQFGAQMSDRIAAMVLVDTAARDVVQNQQLTPPNLPRFTAPVNPLIARAFTSLPVPLPSNEQTSVLSHYIALGPQVRAAHVEFSDSLIAGNPPTTRAAWGSALYHLDVIAGLEAISVPTTVVVGSADLLTPVEQSEFMAAALARNGVLAGLVNYPGAGHMVPIERSTEFNAVLEQVLAGIAEDSAAG